MASGGGKDGNLPSFFQLSQGAGSTLEALGGLDDEELGGLEDDVPMSAAPVPEEKGKVTLDKIDDAEFAAAMAAAGGGQSRGPPAVNRDVDFIQALQDSSSNTIPTFEFSDNRGPPAIPGGFGGLGGGGGANFEALDALLSDTAELDLGTGQPRRGPPKKAVEDVIGMIGKPTHRKNKNDLGPVSAPPAEPVSLGAILPADTPVAAEAGGAADADTGAGAGAGAGAPTNQKGASLLSALGKVGVRQAPAAEAQAQAPGVPPPGPDGMGMMMGLPPNMPLPPMPTGPPGPNGMPMFMPGMPLPPPMAGMPPHVPGMPMPMPGMPMPPPPGQFGMPPHMPGMMGMGAPGLPPPGPGMPGGPPLDPSQPPPPVMVIGPKGPAPIHTVPSEMLPPHLQAVAAQQRELHKQIDAQRRQAAVEAKEKEKEEKKAARAAAKEEKKQKLAIAAAAPGVEGSTSSEVDPKSTNEQGGKLLAMLGGAQKAFEEGKGGDSQGQGQGHTDDDEKAKRVTKAKAAAERAVAGSGERDSLPAHLRGDAVGDEVEKSSGPAWKLPVRPFSSTATSGAGGGSGGGGGGGDVRRGRGTAGRGGAGGRGFNRAGRGAAYAPRGLSTRPRHGQMMQSSDLRFVTDKVMMPLRFDDPYTQDFYYLQKSVKSNAVAREKAVKEQAAMPSMIMVPQPLWKDFKHRIADTLSNQRTKLLKKTSEWEEKEQVLGHVVRSVVTQPRELLAAPTLTSAELDDDASRPFESYLWQMRQQVQNGYESLSTVQELNHLLRSSNIAADPFARAEILAEVDKAVANLAKALGIKGGLESAGAGAGGGVNTAAAIGEASEAAADSAAGSSGGEVKLEAKVVAVIMQSAKGKKLLSRSINLLAPEHRWALLPVVIARLLSADPSTLSDEDKNVEEKLLAAMLQFIQHSKEYQESEQGQAPPGHVAPFSLALLKNLRQCIRGVVVAHLEKAALKNALLTSQTRALLLNNIMELGDSVNTVIKGNVEVAQAQMPYHADTNAAQLRLALLGTASAEWDDIATNFMALLDAAVSAS